MDNLYISAAIVACIFLLARFIEIRFISKSSSDKDGEPESKPMKNIFRDSIIVFVSYILGHFIMKQFSESPVILGEKPDVFTGSPGF
jgi:Na+/H+ antiporter NhaD/arsenite permease-like protein